MTWHEVVVHNTEENGKPGQYPRTGWVKLPLCLTVCGLLSFVCIGILSPTSEPMYTSTREPTCMAIHTVVNLTYTETPYPTFRLLPDPNAASILAYRSTEYDDNVPSVTSVVSSEGKDTHVIAAQVPFYIETPELWNAWSISITALWPSQRFSPRPWGWLWWFTHDDGMQLQVHWNNGALCLEEQLCFPRHPQRLDTFVTYKFDVYPGNNIVSLYVDGNFLGTLATFAPLHVPGGIMFAPPDTPEDGVELDHGFISALLIQTIPPFRSPLFE